MAKPPARPMKSMVRGSPYITHFSWKYLRTKIMLTGDQLARNLYWFSGYSSAQIYYDHVNALPTLGKRDSYNYCNHSDRCYDVRIFHVSGYPPAGGDTVQLKRNTVLGFSILELIVHPFLVLGKQFSFQSHL